MKKLVDELAELYEDLKACNKEINNIGGMIKNENQRNNKTNKRRNKPTPKNNNR